MKSKYKLLQWYPSMHDFAKEGDVFVFSEGVDKIYLGDKLNASWYLPIEECQDNPEFWEPVVEDPSVFHIGKSLGHHKHPAGKSQLYYIYQDKKSYCEKCGFEYFYCRKDCKKWAEEQVQKMKKNYEILKITPNTNHPNYYRGTTPSHIYQYDDTKNMEYFDIHSVRRKSDGEVFTVGDKVEHRETVSDRLIKWEISSMKLVSDRILLYSGTGFHRKLNTTEKRKEPLFITEDGVDIYEGDKHWVPQTTLLDGKWVLNGDIVQYIAHNLRDYESDKSKRFSTKEKAEQYIEENKPKYSEEDIRQAYLELYGRYNCYDPFCNEAYEHLMSIL